MQKSKRVRAIFLALSGACAVGVALRLVISAWVRDITWIRDILERIESSLSFLDSGIWIFIFLFSPFAYLAVFFFAKGYVPSKNIALKISLVICLALLGAYIAIVAFIKVDFMSVLPIWIACGITPVLAAFCTMLFYGGKKWRKTLCVVLASLALCVSTWTMLTGGDYNSRDIIGYSKSPNNTHKVVVVHTKPSKWDVYVACPAWGLWYKQNNAQRVDTDALDHIVWLDENTALLNDNFDYPHTITFK